jgi:hypothetical protein
MVARLYDSITFISKGNLGSSSGTFFLEIRLLRWVKRHCDTKAAALTAPSAGRRCSLALSWREAADNLRLSEESESFVPLDPLQEHGPAYSRNCPHFESS